MYTDAEILAQFERAAQLPFTPVLDALGFMVPVWRLELGLPVCKFERKSSTLTVKPYKWAAEYQQVPVAG